MNIGIMRAALAAGGDPAAEQQQPNQDDGQQQQLAMLASFSQEGASSSVETGNRMPPQPHQIPQNMKRDTRVLVELRTEDLAFAAGAGESVNKKFPAKKRRSLLASLSEIVHKRAKAVLRLAT